MGNLTRLAKSFTIDPEINQYISETKGDRSASDRVNEMLKRAMQEERYAKLEEEAQAFYGTKTGSERKEIRAFQAASIRSITRD